MHLRLLGRQSARGLRLLAIGCNCLGEPGFDAVDVDIDFGEGFDDLGVCSMCHGGVAPWVLVDVGIIHLWEGEAYISGKVLYGLCCAKPFSLPFAFVGEGELDVGEVADEFVVHFDNVLVGPDEGDG